jgi:hypothetical protein
MLVLPGASQQLSFDPIVTSTVTPLCCRDTRHDLGSTWTVACIEEGTEQYSTEQALA